MTVVRTSRDKDQGARRGDTTSREADAPFSSAYFRVLIGTDEVGFCQISRLQATDAAPDTPPDDARPVPTVIFRRAITQSKSLYEWRKRTAAGKRELRDVTIQQCDPTGRAVLNTWVLHGCWPVKWSGPEFNALGNDILMEELEIGCDRIEWV
jgi:hypothetical protein